jgi:riboflavin kinase/FMN adenylyltransferase
MKVVRDPSELDDARRAVGIGSFDGVHLGHRRVLDAARDAGARATAITFWPHPRLAFGHHVELLTTLDRRLELLADAGLDETLVVEFTLDFARVEPEEFAKRYLREIGAATVVAGADFRFGRERRGDVALLRELGFEVRAVPLLEGVSSSEIRRLLREGEVDAAAQLLGRPAEVDGIVVSGDRRGGTLGFPTANLAVDPALLAPRYGIYAGSAEGHRAAVSIGVNPHYGGDERKIEAFLLDFDDDLYGRRLVVELWQRLRDEQAFESEAALVEQIARDVAATRAAERPC